MNSKQSPFFKTLFEEAKTSPRYWLEGSKIEITEKMFLMMKTENVTNSELARRMGVNKAYISRFLQGNTNMTLDTIAKVFFHLGYGSTVNVTLEKLKGSDLEQNPSSQ